MLGPRIEQRMTELGIETQRDLADRAGLSVSYINGLIRGGRGKRISYGATVKLAKALRVKPIFFLSDSATAVKGESNNATAEREVGSGCRI